jgi:hypothetical protein
VAYLAKLSLLISNWECLGLRMTNASLNIIANLPEDCMPAAAELAPAVQSNILNTNPMIGLISGGVPK